MFVIKSKSLALVFLLLSMPVRATNELPLSSEFGITSVTVPVASSMQLRSQLPSDMAYFIVDLKYSPERGVTYIEFGNGLRAGYKVLDYTVGKGFVYKALWERLRAYGMPLWYVGSVPRSQEMSAWHNYLQYGGNHADNLLVLTTDESFQKAFQAPLSTGLFEGKKGIVIIRSLKRESFHQQKFFEAYGDDFLVLNRAISPYVGDKRLTDLLFNDDYLKSFRPKSKAYPREYTPELAGQIRSDIGSEWFVIKPVRSTQGNGVLMVHTDELDDVLETILKRFHNHRPYDNNYLFARYNPLVMQYWKHDCNSHFLVEEYVSSAPIRYNKKNYDATMRAIVFMHYHQGSVRIDFLGEYWKRPLKALEDEGTFREKHLSKHAPNYSQSLGGQVSKEDREGVRDGLAQSLPQLYVNMLTDYYISSELVNQVQVSLDRYFGSGQSKRELKIKTSVYSVGGRRRVVF